MNETVRSAVDALRSQPLALALIVINLVFLVGGVLVLREIGVNMRSERAAQQAFMRELLNCKQTGG